MPQENVPLFVFNRGLISRHALGRVDLKRTALSASVMTNWMPRTLGSMMLRPSYEFIDSTYNDGEAIHVPFIFSLTDQAIIELTDGLMRVRVDEEIVERVSVSSAVTNGTFTSNLTGWTDNDETGASSDWVAGGYMGLKGTGFNAAIRRQQVSVAIADIGKEHALDVVITRGLVTIRVGSTSGAADYIPERNLKPGVYSLAFTPIGPFHITLSSRTEYYSRVDSVTVASPGGMALTTPWDDDDLPFITWDQSGDVVFVACRGVMQRRIERYGTRSWGIAEYAPEDGPFRPENLTPTSIRPNARAGDVSLTATSPVWSSSHVGALFRLNSQGQEVSATLAGDEQYTDPIRIIGVDNQRGFNITITGTWVGTIALQRSSDAESWVTILNYTTNQSTTYYDGLDNQTLYYRLGIVSGSYTSGSATADLAFPNGGLDGIVRITEYSSPTSVSGVVLKHLGATTGTALWAEGLWSSYRGFPSATALNEGRLWFGGKDKIIGSISDAFDSFDDTTEGDSGPISRSLGSGPVDTINWLLPLQRLVVGAEMAERPARSSSQDEPLTPTSFTLKDASTRGSTAVPPGKIDKMGLFVRGGRLFLLTNNGDPYADYSAVDLTQLCPEVGKGGWRRVAVQRYPDTRVHCVRNDGAVGVLIFDDLEEVRCWVEVETDGEVEDVFVLPGATTAEEDKVYYLVNRTVNGSTKRYLERWALESECVGGTSVYDGDSTTTISSVTAGDETADLGDVYPDGTVVTLRDEDGVKIGNNLTVSDGTLTLASAVTYAKITPSLYKLADSHVFYNGVATTTVTAAHLAGEEVVVWGDGKDLGTFTLNGSGQATIPSVETYCAGLYYRARFKSTKLAYAAAMGTALTQKKRVNYLGLILADVHAQSLLYGTDFDHLDALPLDKDGAQVDDNDIHREYDMPATEINDRWSTDSRLCLEAAAPRPCTVLAAVIGMATHDK